MNKLELKVLPAKNKKKLAFFLITLILTTLIFTWAFGTYWGIFAFVIIAASTWSFYIPTTYILDDSGILIKRGPFSYKRSWNLYRRVEKDKNGVFLSPFSKKSRLDAFRGLYIIVDEPEKAEKIYKFIEEKLYGRNSEKTGNNS